MSEVPLYYQRDGIPLEPSPGAYRGTSLTRKRNLLGPYHRPVPRVLGGS